MDTNSFEKIINEAWNNKSQVNSKSSRKILNTITETISLLDSGKIRVAEKKNDEPWASKFSDSEFVNYRTNNLSEFLKKINLAKAA